MGLLALFAWGIGAVVRRERWLAALAATVAAVLGLQLVTLTQPPALVGVLLVAVLVGLLLRRTERGEAGRSAAPPPSLEAKDSHSLA